MIFSCEKDEKDPIDFLTQGKWVLKSEMSSFSDESSVTNKETIQFKAEGTFSTESYLKSVILPYVESDSTKMTLSGKWKIKGHDLTFINEKLIIPKANGQDSIVNMIRVITEGESQARSVLSRWRINYQTNTFVDTIEVKIGNETYKGDPNIVIPDTTGYIITELTEDKLVVWSFINQTRTYYNE